MFTMRHGRMSGSIEIDRDDRLAYNRAVKKLEKILPPMLKVAKGR